MRQLWMSLLLLRIVGSHRSLIFQFFRNKPSFFWLGNFLDYVYILEILVSFDDG